MNAATDGPAGIEMAEKRPPDIILLNIVMPEMDGYEIFAALKRFAGDRRRKA